jgi:hypothetical protein
MKRKQEAPFLEAMAALLVVRTSEAGRQKISLQALKDPLGVSLFGNQTLSLALSRNGMRARETY